MLNNSHVLLGLIIVVLFFSCNKEEVKPNEPDPITPVQWFIDSDEDGFGNPDINMGKLSVEKPLGFVENNSDCDDTDNFINPIAEEDPYDGIDSDCNNEQENIINSLSLKLGGEYNDSAEGVAQTSEGDFVTAGTSYSTGVVNFIGGEDFYLVKTSNEGVIKWEKRYGGPDVDRMTDMYPTSDGGFIMCGVSFSEEGNVRINFGDFDWWVLKVDAEGNIDWEITLGGSDRDVANSIIQTNDGGYLIGGFTGSSDEYVSNYYGFTDGWLVKLDATGNVLWENNYGGYNTDIIESIIELENGDILLGASTLSTDGDINNREITNENSSALWVLRLNNSGDILWEKILEDNFTASDAVLGLNDDVVFTGVSTKSDGEAVGAMVSITQSGIVNWTETYGDSYSNFLSSIDNNNDGGYFVTGIKKINSQSYSNEMWLLNVDNSGTMIWKKSFKESNRSYGKAVKSIDEGIIMTGTSYTGDYSDIWFLKLKPNGKL